MISFHTVTLLASLLFSALLLPCSARPQQSGSTDSAAETPTTTRSPWAPPAFQTITTQPPPTFQTFETPTTQPAPTFETQTFATMETMTTASLATMETMTTAAFEMPTFSPTATATETTGSGGSDSSEYSTPNTSQ